MYFANIRRQENKNQKAQSSKKPATPEGTHFTNKPLQVRKNKNKLKQ